MHYELYGNDFATPMRKELTSLGIKELKNASEVDAVLKNQKGTTLLVVNSVCGCAAGNARPGIKLALQNEVIPKQLTTVFAGQDREATEQARKYIIGYMPSSPAVALFKDGKVTFMLQRMDIEGRTPKEISNDLTNAFNKFCR